MIVYKTTNLINGMIYIGYDTKERNVYLGSGNRLKVAIKKYGRENFKKVMIDSSSNLAELCIKEIFWINFYKARDPEIGYNIADGGQGCSYWTGKQRYAETVEKMRACQMGKKHSEEAKAKISKSLMGNKRSLGRKLSDETKRRLSEVAIRTGRFVGRVPWNKKVK